MINDEVKSQSAWRKRKGFRCPSFALASLGLRSSSFDPTRRRGRQVSENSGQITENRGQTHEGGKQNAWRRGQSVNTSLQPFPLTLCAVSYALCSRPVENPAGGGTQRNATRAGPDRH
jgi:hypothetical protein